MEKTGGVPWFGDIELHTTVVFDAFPPTVGYERFDADRCDLCIKPVPAFVRSTPFGKDAVVVCWSHKRPDEDVIAAARLRAQAFGFHDLVVITEQLFRTKAILANAEAIRFGSRGLIDPNLLTRAEAAARKLGAAATIAGIGEEIGDAPQAMHIVLRLLLDRKLILRDPTEAIDENSRVSAPDPSNPALGDPLAIALSIIAPPGKPRWNDNEPGERCFESFSDELRAKAELKFEYVRAADELIDRFAELKADLYVRRPEPAPRNRNPSKGRIIKLRGYARAAFVYTRWRRIDAARRSPEAKKRAAREEEARLAGAPVERERLPAHVFPALKPPSASTLKEWGRAVEKGGMVWLIDRHDLKGNRHARLDPIVEVVIQKRINRPKLGKVSVILEHVIADLQIIQDKEGAVFQMPSRDALELRIERAMTAKERMAKTDGAKKAEAVFGRKGRFPKPDRPYQVGEIDIAELDTMCVDYDDDGRIVETYRPSVLAIIDKFSNDTHIWILKEFPTAVTVGRFLRRVMRAGVFQYLVIDGGGQFTATSLVAALETELRMRVKLCRAGAAKLKGSIEASFKAQQMAQEFPGDTGSNIQDRRKKQSEAEACISLEKMNEIAQFYARDIRGNEAPRGPGRKTPNVLMREHEDRIPTRDVGEAAMASLLLHEVTCTLKAEGVVHDSIAYDSPRLRRLHELSGEGKKVTVKPDDDDVSYVVAICLETGSRLFVPTTHEDIPIGLTREQLQEQRARDKATSGVVEGRPDKYRAIHKIEEIVKGEEKRGKKARELGPPPKSPIGGAKEKIVASTLASSDMPDTFYRDLAEEFSTNDGEETPEPLVAWALPGVKHNV